MNHSHFISNTILDLDSIAIILQNETKLILSEESRQSIIKCRQYLDSKLKDNEKLLYGINTGFGSLCNIRIPSEKLNELQENLIKSHACGVGEIVPDEIIRIMLLLKIQSLSYGHSGVKVETVERLIEFFNRKLIPQVFTKGSLGASGDLAPLAHLCLPLIGEGAFIINNEAISAKEVLVKENLKPLRLEAKEGLALLNGTQFMLAYAVSAIINAKKLARIADVTSAISIDSWTCKTEPYLPYIHRVRPHDGQLFTAASILEILKGSEISAQSKFQVQDPYSFRCIPQVHGASKDTIAYCQQIIETEVNSVTDNPNIFPDEDLILSGGNFHGQPLALALDFLAIALAELGNISERRSYLLLSGQRNLPEFLVKNPGLNSGLMIAQYAAAALVSENKLLCSPASVDSIPSSNGQEDHVSMGANAATKLNRLIQNLFHILAIEWLTATQALEFRRPQKSSPYLENLVSGYRKQVSFIENDRILHNDILNTVRYLEDLQV